MKRTSTTGALLAMIALVNASPALAVSGIYPTNSTPSGSGVGTITSSPTTTTTLANQSFSLNANNQIVSSSGQVVAYYNPQTGQFTDATTGQLVASNTQNYGMYKSIVTQAANTAAAATGSASAASTAASVANAATAATTAAATPAGLSNLGNGILMSNTGQLYQNGMQVAQLYSNGLILDMNGAAVTGALGGLLSGAVSGLFGALAQTASPTTLVQENYYTSTCQTNCPGAGQGADYDTISYANDSTDLTSALQQQGYNKELSDHTL